MEQPELNDTRLQELYARRVAARGAGAGSPHAEPEAILAVVLREGPEEARLATLDHVMSCAACHREYEWLAAVDRAAAETEAESAARGAPRPWWRQAPLALAASLLLAVGAGLAVRQLVSGGAETVRGGAGDIALMAPADDAEAGAPLTFAWRRIPEASRYVLEVQRQDGSVAFADTTADTTVTLARPAEVLPAADYTWWVRETTDGSEPRASERRTLRLPPR